MDTDDMNEKPETELFEVFIRTRGGSAHRHAGSLNAPDPQLALQYARDLYTRRNEGISLWVIPSAQITASDPQETTALFEPAKDKIYRHPTFYTLPEGAEHI